MAAHTFEKYQKKATNDPNSCKIPQLEAKKKRRRKKERENKRKRIIKLTLDGRKKTNGMLL